MAMSQGLAYAPKLYDMSISKIGNEKVKRNGKKPLKQRTR